MYSLVHIYVIQLNLPVQSEVKDGRFFE